MVRLQLTPNMDRKSGSLNRNGIFDTCNLFGWLLDGSVRPPAWAATASPVLVVVWVSDPVFETDINPLENTVMDPPVTTSLAVLLVVTVSPPEELPLVTMQLLRRVPSISAWDKRNTIIYEFYYCTHYKEPYLQSGEILNASCLGPVNIYITCPFVTSACFHSQSKCFHTLSSCYVGKIPYGNAFLTSIPVLLVTEDIKGWLVTNGNVDPEAFVVWGTAIDDVGVPSNDGLNWGYNLKFITSIRIKYVP